MCRLCNVLYSAHSTPLPEDVISLDAEKAFNQVKWEYVFTVLERFGFGLSCNGWRRWKKVRTKVQSGMCPYLFHEH
jgi:hypothetical protein